MIWNGTIPKAIILYGSDDYLLDQRVRVLLDEAAALDDGEPPELIRLDGDEAGVAEYMEALSEGSLFGGRRVVIVREPRWLTGGKARKGKTADELEPLLNAFLDDPGETTHLVLLVKAWPAGNAIAERISAEGIAEELKAMDRNGLSAWLQSEAEARKVKLDRNALGYMADSGRDGYYLVTELERLALTAGERTVTIGDLTGVHPEAADMTVFKLTDALLRKHPREAAGALQIMLQRGDAPQYILHMIAREYVMLGKCKALRKSGLTTGEIVKKLNQKKSFRVEKMLNAAVQSEDVARVFSLLADTDKALKSTGTNERMLLETLCVDLCAI
ncbi:MAG: DNA polymerase III subunit delta [Solirubrobacterales bacterium]